MKFYYIVYNGCEKWAQLQVTEDTTEGMGGIGPFGTTSTRTTADLADCLRRLARFVDYGYKILNF
jgi:hypothetical protein